MVFICLSVFHVIYVFKMSLCSRSFVPLRISAYFLALSVKRRDAVASVRIKSLSLVQSLVFFAMKQFFCD